MSSEPGTNPFESPTRASGSSDRQIERDSSQPRTVTAVIAMTYLMAAYLMWMAAQSAWDGYQMLYEEEQFVVKIIGEIALIFSGVVAFVALAFGLAAFGMHGRKPWGRILALVVLPFTIVPMGIVLADRQLPGSATWLPASYGIASFLILWTKKCRDYFRSPQSSG